MEPNRGEKKDSGLGLPRTAATSLAIGGIITFLAAFYCVRKVAPEGASFGYYLPYLIPYGIFALLLAALGVVSFIEIPGHPRIRMPSSIASLSGGVLIVGAAIPLGVMLTVWEFMISLIVIGVCIAVISVLSILGLVEEAKKNN
jgi:hypothetical protein